MCKDSNDSIARQPNLSTLRRTEVVVPDVEHAKGRVRLEAAAEGLGVLGAEMVHAHVQQGERLWIGARSIPTAANPYWAATRQPICVTGNHSLKIIG